MCASRSSGPSSSAELHAEVCVVGGGPAGAACALRLARLGHRVLLVERAPRGRPHVGESLPPSVLPLLQEMGVRQAVEQAGFLRPRGALVQWDQALQPAQHDAEEPGFQVDRGRFDALLLQAAEAAGVQVLQAAALPEQAGGSGVSVPLRDGRSVWAEWLVLAHGRRAPAAGEGPRTAALYAYWDGMPQHDPRTRVEAAGEAWHWGAPLPDGSFNATVFVDAARCAGLRSEAREALYRALVHGSSLLWGVLQGRPRGPVQVCDATPRVSAQPVAGRVLRAGEAAFSIDALSSQGVQAALRSGWQAAACVHTMACRPGAAEVAAQFHREQTHRAAARHRRLAAGFHAAAAQRFGSAFWHQRALAHAPPRAAFASAALPPLHAWVALDPAARRCTTGALQGDFIEPTEALVHPALEAPVSFVGGLPIGRVLHPLRNALPVSALLSAWRADWGDEGAAQLLTRLWRQGIVVPASWGSSSPG
ncbi:MAG: FAD-dependent oxidoreductase [Pseudomonadota bacterium]